MGVYAFCDESKYEYDMILTRIYHYGAIIPFHAVVFPADPASDFFAHFVILCADLTVYFVFM